VFSELTLPCDVVTKEAIIKQYYLPYREQIETIINGLVGMNRPVLHFSIHSFTPRLGKVVRKADLGLLYDPSRNLEKGYARQLQRILKTGSNYVIRLNYPYRGKADGLTTALRKRYPAGQYSGMEIEINQKWLGSRGRSPAITGLLCAAIRELSDYKP
jgi:predicted N-formylglutamate amidohydrolase